MNYICECGKTFDNSQKFNGHKRHCLTHAEATGKLQKIQEADKVAAKKASDIATLRRKRKLNISFNVGLMKNILVRSVEKS